jgi:hypothetical protein
MTAPTALSTLSPTPSQKHAAMLMLSAANTVTQSNNTDSTDSTAGGDADMKKETLKMKDTKVDDGLCH